MASAAQVVALGGELRYAVCYTDSRRRARKKVFRQFDRAARFAKHLRMGSSPTIQAVVKK